MSRFSWDTTLKHFVAKCWSMPKLDWADRPFEVQSWTTFAWIIFKILNYMDRTINSNRFYEFFRIICKKRGSDVTKKIPCHGKYCCCSPFLVVLWNWHSSNDFKFRLSIQNRPTTIQNSCKNSSWLVRPISHLVGFVSEQSCRIWASEKPRVIVKNTFHPQCETIWCGLWSGGFSFFN